MILSWQFRDTKNRVIRQKIIFTCQISKLHAISLSYMTFLYSKSISKKIIHKQPTRLNLMDNGILKIIYELILTKVQTEYLKIQVQK